MIKIFIFQFVCVGSFPQYVKQLYPEYKDLSYDAHNVSRLPIHVCTCAVTFLIKAQTSQTTLHTVCFICFSLFLYRPPFPFCYLWYSVLHPQPYKSQHFCNLKPNLIDIALIHMPHSALCVYMILTRISDINICTY